jgi:ABC-2 type transport system ATP-binding protein
MTDTGVITIYNLSKTYRGSENPALKGISLTVNKGEIFGLLGPNGAGKTTTINILCGFLQKDSGDIHIKGWTVGENTEDIKRVIGLVPQDIALYDTLSPLENLRFIGNMYGMRGRRLRTRISECLHLLGLEKSRNRLVRTFSGGMKRRLNLIAGILHEPEILFLDEPTVGIDVQSRTVILDYLREINRKGTTIIYTSHYLEEAEQLCTEIAILDNGEIIIRGRTKEMTTANMSYTSLENIFLNLTGRSLRDI